MEGIGIGRHRAGRAGLLVVAPQAGGGAVVLAQAALLQAGRGAQALRLGEAITGDEVAEQQVALALVDPQEQARARPGVHAAQGRVAVHRVDLVGPDVAQQAGSGVLVAVVGRGQQQVAAHRAFQVEGSAGRHIALVAIELPGPTADFTLEHIAALHRLHAALAQVDHALHQAGRQHGPQLGQEADVAGRHLFAGRHPHQHVHGLVGRQQGELGHAA